MNENNSGQSSPTSEPNQPASNSGSAPPQDSIVESSGFQTMIPTKNPYSLLSYYLGFFSFLPIIGIVTAILGIIYGRKALKIHEDSPTPGAKGHANTGIFLSVLWLSIHILTIVFIFFVSTQS